MPRAVALREEIKVPGGVEVELEGSVVRVRGPKGAIERDFGHVKGVKVSKTDGTVILEAYFADRRLKARFYSVASHIKNMIDGVTRGYRYKLKIIYAHFPVSVKVEGDRVIIENFLGEKAPRVAKIVGNVRVSVTKTDIIVEGCDLEAVAQTAANIEQATKIKDYDRRVFVDGIYIYERGYAD